MGQYENETAAHDGLQMSTVYHDVKYICVHKKDGAEIEVSFNSVKFVSRSYDRYNCHDRAQLNEINLN